MLYKIRPAELNVFLLVYFSREPRGLQKNRAMIDVPQIKDIVIIFLNFIIINYSYVFKLMISYLTCLKLIIIIIMTISILNLQEDLKMF